MNVLQIGREDWSIKYKIDTDVSWYYLPVQEGSSRDENMLTTGKTSLRLCVLTKISVDI